MLILKTKIILYTLTVVHDQTSYILILVWFVSVAYIHSANCCSGCAFEVLCKSCSARTILFNQLTWCMIDLVIIVVWSIATLPVHTIG
jgi:hypothetical protein